MVRRTLHMVRRTLHSTSLSDHCMKRFSSSIEIRLRPSVTLMAHDKLVLVVISYQTVEFLQQESRRI